jgi:signal transduction histidine kinase/DNA-binding response OmpR family regulator
LTEPDRDDDPHALRRCLERERAQRRAAEAQLSHRSRELLDTYQSLQRAYEELDARVAERTRALQEANLLLQSEIEERHKAEDRLREARDRAEVATDGLRFALDESERLRQAAEVAARTKAEFLANMSHEIRTPMNGILGMVQLLETTMLSGVQHQYLETVRTSADALLALINDILDLSKIEAGGMDIEEIPFDLVETVENVGDLLAMRAHEKGVDLVVRYGPGLPGVLRGDPDRLRQVLVNLLGNAVKFTPAGHVLLSAACERIEDGRAHLVLEVKDTGIGIDADKLEMIFEKFTQADGSTTRLYGGTGLGLSISRELAEMMGGTLTAESRRGEGSTFRLRIALPVVEAAPTAVPASYAGGRALVLDPSPLSRCVLVELLGELGVAVDEAGSPEDLRPILAAAQKPAWRWILAEIEDAHAAAEIASSVRERYGELAPTLIAVTRLGSGADRLQLLEHGFQGLVMKPIRPSRLPDQLEKARGGALEVPQVSRRPRAATSLRRPPSAAARPIRILVAEDNPVNQRVAQGILEKMGCLVEIAGDGREALARVSADCPDLVFMDCQMPAMDGYAAAREIRRLEGPAGDVPIIAMTAHAMAGDREKCLEAGMSDYVAKPVRIGAVREAIEKWCGGGVRPSELSAPASPGAGAA